MYLSKSFRVGVCVYSCAGHGSRVCVPFDKVVDDCDLTSWPRENDMRALASSPESAPRSSSNPARPSSCILLVHCIRTWHTTSAGGNLEGGSRVPLVKQDGSVSVLCAYTFSRLLRPVGRVTKARSRISRPLPLKGL
jgi:hypothetical protein